MADGGGSSSGGASGGTSAGASGTSAGAAQASEGATKAGGEASQESKEGAKASESEKKGAVIDDKPVTVKEVKEKSTIDKDHVEGEEKKKPDEKKHKYHDRLIKAYPDRKFASDEDYETAHEEYVTDLEGYKDRGVKANERLINLFKAEPRVADIVRQMINGETFVAALARHVSPEELAAKPGDPDYEVWEKNSKDRTERIKQTEAKQKEMETNMEFSAKAIKEFADENKMTEEQAGKFLGQVDEMLQSIYQGKITKETLAKIKRALEYDTAVQSAKEEGEIKGRNEKITAEKEKEKPKDDGLPHIKKGGKEGEETPLPEGHDLINRIVEGAKKRQVF